MERVGGQEQEIWHNPTDQKLAKVSPTFLHNLDANRGNLQSRPCSFYPSKNFYHFTRCVGCNVEILMPVPKLSQARAHLAGLLGISIINILLFLSVSIQKETLPQCRE